MELRDITLTVILAGHEISYGGVFAEWVCCWGSGYWSDLEEGVLGIGSSCGLELGLLGWERGNCWNA
jgi:hypothetical protein